VRGFVYEAAGSVPPDLLAAGAQLVEHTTATFRIPTRIVAEDPGDHARWLEAMTAAVAVVLLKPDQFSRSSKGG
jgi:hypothetical protein